MQEWIKNNIKLVAIATVVVIGIIVIAWSSAVINIRNEGERQEQELTQLYNQSINSLSTCIDQGRIAAQVTDKEFEALKEILVETAAARYADGGSATDVLGGGSMFSAIVEQYPTIDQRSWQNLQTIVVGCRDEFQGAQDRLQNEARTYEQWRVTNNLFSTLIKDDFPSDELKITTPDGTVLTGQDAYDRITRVVAVEDANTAFETGVLEEQDLFGEG